MQEIRKLTDKLLIGLILVVIFGSLCINQTLIQLEVEQEKSNSLINSEMVRTYHGYINIAEMTTDEYVLKGQIIPPAHCQTCGLVKKLQAHHPDYNDPLDIVWLCI